MILFLLVIIYVLGLLFLALKKIIFKGQWEYTIIFMALYLPFYTTILSIAYQATGSEIVVAVFQYLKEFVLLLSLIAYILYQKDPFSKEFNLNTVDRLFLGFLGLAVVYLFLPLGSATFINKLLYLKNTLLIGLFYFLGRNSQFPEIKTDKLFQYIMLIIVAAFCLNLLESAIGIHFQNFTGYALFNFAINDVEPSGNYGLTWTFETQTTGMRLASFFSDPLELASACLLGFSTGLIWYLTTNRGIGNVYILVMLAAAGSLFLSSSRAAFGAFFLMLFFIAFIFRLYRLFMIGGAVLVIFALYVVYWADDEFYYFVYDTITFQNASSIGHLVEWALALDSMILNPEGIGLAMSGNTGSVEDEIRVGGENQFLIYGVQLGVLGMVLYILILLFGIRKSIFVFNKSENIDHARIAFVAAATKFGLLLPLFTANAELYAYVSLVSWWMIGHSMTAYNQIKYSEKSGIHII